MSSSTGPRVGCLNGLAGLVGPLHVLDWVKVESELGFAT